MKHYAGLDVSNKLTAISILDQEGKIICQNEVPTEPKAIFEYLQNLNLPIEKVGMESGGLSHWLMKELKKQMLPMVCMESRKMGALIKTQINKTDKNDSRVIADALRCKYYNEVHQKEQDHVELKMLLTIRSQQKQTLVQYKNSIRGHLKMFGIRLPAAMAKDKFFNEVKKIISTKSDVVQKSVSSLLQTFRFMSEQIDLLEKNIKEVARKDADAKLLMTVPGVGAIIALTFKVLVGDPKRFKKSKTLGAYFGMTPRQDSSGDTVKLGRISKCGSNDMRALLNEGAVSLLHKTKSWSKIKIWGLKLARKKGNKKAHVAVGRKLCTIMHRMLITRKPFEYCEEPKKAVELLKRPSKTFKKFSPKEEIHRMKDEFEKEEQIAAIS